MVDSGCNVKYVILQSKIKKFSNCNIEVVHFYI